jgi:hypothetical protein
MIAGTAWQHVWGYVFEPDRHDLTVYKVANVLYQRKKMDVYFTTHGISAGGKQPLHVIQAVRQWLAAMPHMRPDGSTSFVMRNVQENPSSVIANLKALLTPDVLSHMHSDSIWSTHDEDDFNAYHRIDLCFNDVMTVEEWNCTQAVAQIE